MIEKNCSNEENPNRNYRSLAERFMEIPVIHHPGEDLLKMASILSPYPTFCTWRGIPTIDDVDMLE